MEPELETDDDNPEPESEMPRDGVCRQVRKSSEDSEALYQNQNPTVTNERQTENTLDMKYVTEWSTEPFWTRVSAPRNDCQWRRLWNIKSRRWKVYLLHKWK